MKLKIYFRKIPNCHYWLMDKINKKKFIKKYPIFLRKLGIDIPTNGMLNSWISPSTFFDSSNYSLIHISKDVTISFGVVILVHDYSYVHAARAMGEKGKTRFLSVSIGNNVFIGAKSIILPGTIIEDNVIIGAGAICSGTLKSGYVYGGNPAKPIKTVKDYFEKYKKVE